MSEPNHTSDLLPCPFCGGPVQVIECHHDRLYYQIECCEGGCVMGWGLDSFEPDRDALVREWNRRTPFPVNAELLEALEAAVDCGMVPVSSAKDGGAVKYSKHVKVADQIRSAIAKAKGEDQ